MWLFWSACRYVSNTRAGWPGMVVWQSPDRAASKRASKSSGLKAEYTQRPPPSAARCWRTPAQDGPRSPSPPHAQTPAGSAAAPAGAGRPCTACSSGSLRRRRSMAGRESWEHRSTARVRRWERRVRACRPWSEIRGQARSASERRLRMWDSACGEQQQQQCGPAGSRCDGEQPKKPWAAHGRRAGSSGGMQQQQQPSTGREPAAASQHAGRHSPPSQAPGLSLPCVAPHPPTLPPSPPPHLHAAIIQPLVIRQVQVCQPSPRAAGGGQQVQARWRHRAGAVCQCQ